MFFPADDDLTIQPRVVKLFGGVGMHVLQEELRQTNDKNIPGFESLFERFEFGLPHDGRSRISMGRPTGSYGMLQLGLPKKLMVRRRRWLVIDLPILAAANGWLKSLAPCLHRLVVLELVDLQQRHDGINTHLTFWVTIPLRSPEVTTLPEQLGQIIDVDVLPMLFEPLSILIPIQSAYGQEGGPGGRKTIQGS